MSATGGCLCGAVRFAVRGPLRDALVCHCAECRRWSGGAWTATAARRSDVALTGEVRWLASPQSEHGASRGNCSRCGACLFWDAPGRDTLSVSVGALDDPYVVPVAGHIWVDHALPWQRPGAGVLAYPRGYPPEAPALAWREEGAGADGVHT